MKKQLLSIIGVLILGAGVCSFVYQDNKAVAEEKPIIYMPSENDVIALEGAAELSSVYAYKEVSMGNDSLTVSQETLSEWAADVNLEGVKLKASDGAIIMNRAYLQSLENKAQGSVTFQLSINGDTVAVSAKANGSTIYGDQGLCLVEADYAGGNLASAVKDSKNQFVGTSCYYGDGAVMRWQLADSETYTFVVEPVTFNDTANHWSKDYVAFLSSRGVIAGMSTGYFQPETKVTRGQYISFLARLANVDLETYTTEDFNDVASDDYFYNPVCWGVAAGIIAGRSTTEFAPAASITREEMATMCWRYFDYLDVPLKEVRTPSDFSDTADISAYAVTAVRQSYAAGFISGQGNNIFAPKANATRAEAATMMACLVSYLAAMPH